MKVTPGVLLMSVHANERDTSFYQFTAHFYNKPSEVPFGRLVAGNKGIIEWQLDQGQTKKIIIKFY